MDNDCNIYADIDREVLERMRKQEDLQMRTESSASMTGGVDSSFEYSAPVIQPIEPKSRAA